MKVTNGAVGVGIRETSGCMMFLKIWIFKASIVACKAYTWTGVLRWTAARMRLPV
jgi:hypothetical protein